MSNHMEILHIIPARGGSKGIKNKNLKLLKNKPIVAHAIDTSLKSKYITRVVVSTDKKEIGQVALDHGAEVVWRPAVISGDKATTESALLYTIDYYKKTENYLPDYICLTQATTPLTLPEDIDQTIQLVIEQKASTGIGCGPFESSIWVQENKPFVKNITNNFFFPGDTIDRHKTKNEYLEGGAIWVFETKGFLRVKFKFWDKIVMHVMDANRVYDIDEPVDYSIIESIINQR